MANARDSAGEIHRFTDATGTGYMGDRSPDGERIVFASDRVGNMESRERLAVEVIG